MVAPGSELILRCMMCALQYNPAATSCCWECTGAQHFTEIEAWGVEPQLFSTVHLKKLVPGDRLNPFCALISSFPCSHFPREQK